MKRPALAQPLASLMLAAAANLTRIRSAAGRMKPVMSELKAQDRFDVPPLQLSGDAEDFEKTPRVFSL